ncbi:histone chaperone Rttp106-like-domain-containing protein [Schizophyllum commune]
MATAPPEATFLNTTLSHLPDEIRAQIAPLLSSEPTVHVLENFTRFLSGAAPVSASSSSIADAWQEKQRKLAEALTGLRGASSGTKRSLEADEASGSEAKRQRVSEETTRYRLHGISVTSPIRKKVDILVTDDAIVLVNSATSAVEASVPRSAITRSFILPTRGKTKSHYTVVMLDADVVRPAKGKTAAQASAQVIFGIDAQATANTRVTPTVGQTTTIERGSSVHTYLRAFLEAAGAPIYEPSGDTLKSAHTTSAGTSASTNGIPGVEAYRGAKPGTLWFFEEGLLWGESKPCEFWAVEDLLGATDGVRILSATGRTLSVTLTRRSAEVDEDGEDLGEETQLSMIDGREQDGIAQWVRKHRHLFGKTEEEKARAGASDGGSKPLKAPAPVGPITIHQLAAESDDEEDEDFQGSSSDEGSGSESGEEVEGSENAEGEDEDEEGEAASSDEDEEMADGDGDDAMGLDERHHPLLRPGAMPKMSRAAMDAVVGMVERDFVGADDGDGADEGEEEEDELDD